MIYLLTRFCLNILIQAELSNIQAPSRGCSVNVLWNKHPHKRPHMTYIYGKFSWMAHICLYTWHWSWQMLGNTYTHSILPAYKHTHVLYTYPHHTRLYIKCISPNHTHTHTHIHISRLHTGTIDCETQTGRNQKYKTNTIYHQHN